MGLTHTPEARDRLLRLMKPFLPLIQKLSGPPKPISGAHVAVHGIKDGKPAVIEMTAVGRMRDLTALPQVVATLMVGRREVSLPGVIAPEAREVPILTGSSPRSRKWASPSKPECHDPVSCHRDVTVSHPHFGLLPWERGRPA